MIKLRDAKYCNLKCLLLYLVVYGHWIEPYTDSFPVLLIQYRAIYLFHMPLFTFLSGLFLHRKADCLRQLKRLLPLFFILQSISILLGSGKIDPFTPYWTLWYLLSYSIWLVFGWIWFHFGKGRFQFLILMLSLCLGCLVGFFSWIGRPLSLSRTIVFFPYFWIGLLCDPQKLQHRLRPWCIPGLIIFTFCFFLFGRDLPISFLYQASPYNFPEQLWLRLGCYLCGFSMSVFLLFITPSIRLPFTRAGADTLPGYLLHAPLVLILRSFPIPPSWLPLLSALLLYIIYKVIQWKGSLYGIISERRYRAWPDLKKSTTPIADRSTDSSYL